MIKTFSKLAFYQSYHPRAFYTCVFVHRAMQEQGTLSSTQTEHTNWPQTVSVMCDMSTPIKIQGWHRACTQVRGAYLCSPTGKCSQVILHESHKTYLQQLYVIERTTVTQNCDGGRERWRKHRAVWCRTAWLLQHALLRWCMLTSFKPDNVRTSCTAVHCDQLYWWQCSQQPSRTDCSLIIYFSLLIQVKKNVTIHLRQLALC